MVPLPTAGDLVTVLYQFSLDADASLVTAARGTVDGLPERVLVGAASDARLDPRVLDWLAPRFMASATLFDAALVNPSLADETIATLAAKAGPDAVDRLATNEQRLLRHPDIIAAMYTNPRARMSTVTRAVELAVRNQIRVPGLAAWDEIAKSLDAAGPGNADDAAFAAAAERAMSDDSALTSGDPEAVMRSLDDGPADIPVVEDVPISKMSVPERIRLATMGNAFARSQLVRDPVKLVAMAAIKSPGITDVEAARYAGNAGLSEEIIRFIGARGKWTKLYSVKLALIGNPKATVAESMRLLPHLREKDLRAVSRSKGMASAIVAQAKKLMSVRSGGK